MNWELFFFIISCSLTVGGKFTQFSVVKKHVLKIPKNIFFTGYTSQEGMWLLDLCEYKLIECCSFASLKCIWSHAAQSYPPLDWISECNACSYCPWLIEVCYCLLNEFEACSLSYFVGCILAVQYCGHFRLYILQIPFDIIA